MSISDDASRDWISALGAGKVHQYYWDASSLVGSGSEEGSADKTSVFYDKFRQQLYVSAYNSSSVGNYTDVGAMHVFAVPESPSNAPTAAPTCTPTESVPTSAPITASPTTVEEGCQVSILATSLYTMFYRNQECGTMLSWGIDVEGTGTLYILAGVFLLGPLALEFFIVSFIFVTWSYLIVIWSAITKSKHIVFSGINTKREFQWIGGQDDSIAMVVAVISVVLTVVNLSLIPVFNRA